MDLNYINMEKENIDFNTTSSDAAGTSGSDAAGTVAPEASTQLWDSAGSSPESCLLENLTILSTESLTGSTRLSTSSQPDKENVRLARVDQQEQRAQQAHCQLVPSVLNGPLTQEILRKK